MSIRIHKREEPAVVKMFLWFMFIAILLCYGAKPLQAAQADPFWHGMDEATLLKMVGKDKFAFIDRTGGGEMAVVAMVVDAPSDTIWKVLTDFENYTKYIRECNSSKIKKQSDKGVTVDFKMTLLKAGPVNLASSYTLSYTFEKGKRLVFTSVGDNGKSQHGTWELVPVQGGKRTILFHSTISDFKSAGSLAKYMVERSPTLQISVCLANAMIYVEQIKRAAEKVAR